MIFPDRVTAPPAATALLLLMVSATSVTPTQLLLRTPDCSMLPDCYKLNLHCYHRKLYLHTIIFKRFFTFG